MIAEFIFWFGAALLIYTFIGFPLLLLLRALLFPKPYQQAESDLRVSIVIAAYNEAEVIEARLRNATTLDYPADRLQVIVASDGSDDGTNDIVARFADDRVRLIALPRGGKHIALNAAVAQATGDILVFSDANSMYAPDALKQITRPFADPRVGGAAGDQRYVREGSDSAGSAGEHSYWNLDRVLKRLESASGNVISATGAIYAIRRSLFTPVAAAVTDDFYTSTRVIMQGYRLVFAEDAIAYEPTAKSQKSEFGRKVRIMTRGLNAVKQNRALLNPFRYGFYAVQLFTHKVLRRMLFIPLALIAVSNIALFDVNAFYQFTLIAQGLFYAAALIGALLDRGGIALPKLFVLPAYFCVSYWAAMLATWNVVRGRRIDRWSTHREPSA